MNFMNFITESMGNWSLGRPLGRQTMETMTKVGCNNNNNNNNNSSRNEPVRMYCFVLGFCFRVYRQAKGVRKEGRKENPKSFRVVVVARNALL